MVHTTVGNIELPVIGLGTYALDEKNMPDIFDKCIENGVVFIDSANRYDNELAIGNTLRNLNIPRDRVTIGTKLSYKQQMTMDVNQAVSESLKKLKTDYIDLYFIHSTKSNTYCRDWISMQKEKEEGRVLEIGVSNFGITQLQEIYNLTGEYPAINQIEVNLYHYPHQLIDFCKDNGIVVQASCPLCRMNESLLNNGILTGIMEKYRKTYPQIVLRWLFEHKIISIPKMSSANHLLENIQIFDMKLDDEDMIRLDNLATDNMPENLSII